MTRGTLCIQGTTDVHGYDNFPTDGGDKTDLRIKHPFCFVPGHHTSEGFRVLVPLSARPDLLPTRVNSIPLEKPI